MESIARRRIHISVIGAGTCSEAVHNLAEAVGAEIARRGAVLVCGGLGGVMEAAACGARRAGGLTVGVLPSYDRSTANRWLDVVLPTGFGHARNVIVVASGDAVIALPGEYGTASEIALALKLGRCVIGLQAWEDYLGILHAGSAREAVDLALQTAGGED